MSKPKKRVEIDFNPMTQIIIQRVWLERLEEIRLLVKNSQGDNKNGWLQHLLGYLESVDYILKQNTNDDLTQSLTEEKR